MMAGLRRHKSQREIVELEEDPNFPFYVGRLVGAAEMVSHWLALKREVPEAQEMGRRLNMIVDWFMVDTPPPSQSPQQLPVTPTTQQTQKRP